jgi:hypothetical protein
MYWFYLNRRYSKVIWKHFEGILMAVGIEGIRSNIEGIYSI